MGLAEQSESFWISGAPSKPAKPNWILWDPSSRSLTYRMRTGRTSHPSVGDVCMQAFLCSCCPVSNPERPRVRPTRCWVWSVAQPTGHPCVSIHFSNCLHLSPSLLVLSASGMEECFYTAGHPNQIYASQFISQHVGNIGLLIFCLIIITS